MITLAGLLLLVFSACRPAGSRVSRGESTGAADSYPVHKDDGV